MDKAIADEIPASVSELSSALTAEGFAFVDASMDRESFGNIVIDWRGSEFVVRAVRDRGQWFLDLGQDEKTLAPVFVWAKRLGYRRPVDAIEDQCRFVSEHLDALSAAITS